MSTLDVTKGDQVRLKKQFGSSHTFILKKGKCLTVHEKRSIPAREILGYKFKAVDCIVCWVPPIGKYMDIPEYVLEKA